MKNSKKLAIITLLVCLMFGCSTKSSHLGQNNNDNNSSSSIGTEMLIEYDKDRNQSSDTDAEPVTDSSTSESVSLAPTCMPVLSIETKKQTGDIMSFVTEPVSQYVAESIASWTPGYHMPPTPYYEECYVILTDTDNTLLLDTVETNVKVRGNWTTAYDKKPLRIKFSEKQNMLGLNNGAQMKNWVLLAGYKDGSLLRDKTALSIAREILGEDGLYAADAQFVEVEINHQYWGVYLLTELQQVNQNRIDITENGKDYTGTDIGYFMEFDGYFCNEEPLQQFYVDYSDNAPLIPFDGNEGSGRTITCLGEGDGDYKQDIGITIKSDINSQEQHDFIESYINNVYRIMYAAAYNDEAYQFTPDFSSIMMTNDITPQEAVENVVDVQSLADMYIISELTCDADIYWSSFFMDADFGPDGSKRLTFEAPWDFDSSMGNKDRCADAEGFYAANIVPDVNDVYETINPWLAVLMYEDWFRDIISEKWTAAYDSGIFRRGIEQIMIDSEQFSSAFDRNYQKWNNIINNNAFAGELCYDSQKCRTHAEAAEYLEKWLSDRVDFLNNYWHE